jgi:hypothetical protein
MFVGLGRETLKSIYHGMTTADFYLGRGASAIWIGSVGAYGKPETLPRGVVSAGSQEAFRGAVKRMVHSVSQGVSPEIGWPWRRNSLQTDYVYAWDEERIFVSVAGEPWRCLRTWESSSDEKPTYPHLPFSWTAAEKASGTGSRGNGPHKIMMAEMRRRIRGHS